MLRFKISSVALVSGSRQETQRLTGQGKAKCISQAPQGREDVVLVILGPSMSPRFLAPDSRGFVLKKTFALSATKPGFCQSILPLLWSSCILVAPW